jgi:hypothetical protein
MRKKNALQMQGINKRQYKVTTIINRQTDVFLAPFLKVVNAS